MTRDSSLLLREILEAIRLIGEYVQGLDFDGFASSTEKQDAVVRRLVVIGEAVKGLPEDLRSQHADVRWREIAGTRDILIHEYFRVDLSLAWQMVTRDLPELDQEESRRFSWRWVTENPMLTREELFRPWTIRGPSRKTGSG